MFLPATISCFVIYIALYSNFLDQKGLFVWQRANGTRNKIVEANSVEKERLYKEAEIAARAKGPDRETVYDRRLDDFIQIILKKCGNNGMQT